MHSLHARLPRNFVLEERLERYADAIELKPAQLAGRWAEACAPVGAAPFREVRLDLGCGKGAFLVESARREPDVLFVGLDGEPVCIAYTAQHILEAGLRNAVVAPALGSDVCRIFGEGELAELTINFPTPYPRKKEADKRLVSLERLLEYRRVLAADGRLVFKTDHEPLFAFAQTQFELAGYEILYLSDDYRADHADTPASEYEERLGAAGAHVHAIIARVGELDGVPEQTASLSLVDYLPSDLHGLDYVPHGMQGTVVNLRNRRDHEALRLGR